MRQKRTFRNSCTISHWNEHEQPTYNLCQILGVLLVFGFILAI